MNNFLFYGMISLPYKVGFRRSRNTSNMGTSLNALSKEVVCQDFQSFFGRRDAEAPGLENMQNSKTLTKDFMA